MLGGGLGVDLVVIVVVVVVVVFVVFGVGNTISIVQCTYMAE